MKLLQLYDVIFEAKEDKLAQTFGNKLLAKFRMDRSVPPNIRQKVVAGGDEQIPLQIIKFLAQYDTTPQRKYLQWMVLQYVRGQLLLEDAYKLPETLQKFEKYSDKLPIKNIDQYKSYRDLEKAIGVIEREMGAMGMGERSTGLKTLLARPDIQKGMENAEVVYQSPRLLVVRPLSRQASCDLGKGTKWCVAATTSTNYFDHYTKQGPLYFMYTDQGRKYGIHFETGNFMDEQDHPVNILEIIDANPEVLKAFNPDQISLAAAKGWNTGDWKDKEKPSLNGVQMFVEMWKKYGFVATPRGQMRLASTSPIFILDLHNAGFPVVPEAHAVAIERIAFMGDPAFRDKIYKFYHDMAEQGELPLLLRLALIGNKGLAAYGTPEEKQEIANMREFNPEERAEEFGSIRENYEANGITPVLLERIRMFVEDGGGDAPWFSIAKDGFVTKIYDNIKEATNYLDLGDSAEWAMNVIDGADEVNVGPPSHLVTGEVLELLNDGNTRNIFEKMIDNEFSDNTHEAFKEYATDNDFEIPLNQDGDMDYASVLQGAMFPNGLNGEIDKNMIEELLEYDSMKGFKDNLESVLSIVWQTSMESAERDYVSNKFIAWLSNGIDGETAGYHVELVPRDDKEYINHEEPFLMNMSNVSYIDMLDEVERGDYSYPEFNADDTEMETFDYEPGLSDADLNDYSVNDAFDGYWYMFDER